MYIFRVYKVSENSKNNIMISARDVLWPIHTVLYDRINTYLNISLHPCPYCSINGSHMVDCAYLKNELHLKAIPPLTPGI